MRIESKYMHTETRKKSTQLTSLHVTSPSTTAIETPGTCHNCKVSLTILEKSSCSGLFALPLRIFCSVADEITKKPQIGKEKSVKVFNIIPFIIALL